MMIKLGISDRYSIMEALIPLNGSLTDMITCKALLKDVEFTEEDMIKSGMNSSEKGITWSRDLVKEVELSPNRLDVLKKAIVQLAQNGGLSGIIGTDLVFKLNFTQDEKNMLSNLVNELDREGKVNNSILQACLNVKELLNE